MSPEELFVSACYGGILSEVKRLAGLKINVNWKDRAGSTGLYYACAKSHSPVVQHLLTIPEIDINLASKNGCTPLCWSCRSDNLLDIIEMLLRDDRVDAKKPNMFGITPLGTACLFGQVKVVKMLLASGRDLDVGRKDVELKTAADRARERSGFADEESVAACADTLGAYLMSPKEAMKKLREELCWITEEADTLALIVFLSDGLLTIRVNPQPEDRKATRFFSVASRLPFELQMLLAHTTRGKASLLIPFQDRERGFRHLAKIFSRELQDKNK